MKGYSTPSTTPADVVSSDEVSPSTLTSARARLIRRLERTPTLRVLAQLQEFADALDGTGLTLHAFVAGFSEALGLHIRDAGVEESVRHMYGLFNAGAEPVRLRQIAAGIGVFGEGDGELCSDIFTMFADSTGGTEMTIGAFTEYATATLATIAAHHPDAPGPNATDPHRMAAAVARALFTQLDTSGDGVLSFKEFARWFTENMGRDPDDSSSASAVGEGGGLSSASASGSAVSGAEVESVLGMSCVPIESLVYTFEECSSAERPGELSHDAFIKCVLSFVGIEGFDATGAVIDHYEVNFAERLFAVFDADGNNWLSFLEVGIGLSLICSPDDPESACRVLFSLCATRTGLPVRIARRELEEFAAALLRGATLLGGNSYSNSMPPPSPSSNVALDCNALTATFEDFRRAFFQVWPVALGLLGGGEKRGDGALSNGFKNGLSEAVSSAAASETQSLLFLAAGGENEVRRRSPSPLQQKGYTVERPSLPLGWPQLSPLPAPAAIATLASKELVIEPTIKPELEGEVSSHGRRGSGIGAELEEELRRSFIAADPEGRSDVDEITLDIRNVAMLMSAYVSLWSFICETLNASPSLSLSLSSSSSIPGAAHATLTQRSLNAHPLSPTHMTRAATTSPTTSPTPSRCDRSTWMGVGRWSGASSSPPRRNPSGRKSRQQRQRRLRGRNTNAAGRHGVGCSLLQTYVYMRRCVK